MGSYLYAFVIYPIEMLIETVFSVSMEMVPSVGYAIIFVSIAVQLLVLPIYKKADELQEEERQRQKKMAPWVEHIKKVFKGDERVMMLSTYYRKENYHALYQLRGILPLLLQIPFFIAAYDYLSKCPALEGASFYFLKDMGRPDGLLVIGGIAINVMPVAMTLINIISGMIYTRGLGMRDKLQLFITAGVFLVLLYDSPSGLVFYWTLNNVFSLLKNIFMKLVKHPREIASFAAMMFGLLYCYKCYTIGGWEASSGRIVMVIVFIAGCIPMTGLLLDRFAPGSKAPMVTAEERAVFRTACLTATVTLGVLIPAATVASSPLEFIIKGHYVNPLLQILYCFVVSAGIFMLWGSIFFHFYPARSKKILCYVMPAAVICGLADSQFFTQNLDNMSMNMVYLEGFVYDMGECLINLGVLAVVCIICLFICTVSRKTMVYVCHALFGVCVVMSLYNVIKIQRTVNAETHIKDDGYYTHSAVHYELDREGKNVVILFEDRAFGQFLPYILNEKPELNNVYSGFTYYKNTISYGTATRAGAPPLYGGYEYTQYNARGRDEAYLDYVVDAFKVMPRLFAENGFKTTVFDLPYFINLENSSIEDFYKEVDSRIKAYYADGAVRSEEEAIRDFDYFQKAARRNFIRHSIFLSSPLALREWIHDGGKYLTQELADDWNNYAGHIEELDKLDELARVSSDGADTFTIIENDTPHTWFVNLQMPDYSLVERADNSDYINKWRDTLSRTPGDRKINMYTDEQIKSYEVNMATILSIGRWLEWLKENDLYDNTRIIIVADHGYDFFAFDDMQMDTGDGEYVDLEQFTPLLLVKDFADASAEKPLATSGEFMTNADVPTIAFRELINDPVNPYTGNKISNDQKYEREQYVYDLRVWLSIKDDIYDLKNWGVADIK